MDAPQYPNLQRILDAAYPSALSNQLIFSQAATLEMALDSRDPKAMVEQLASLASDFAPEWDAFAAFSEGPAHYGAVAANFSAGNLAAALGNPGVVEKTLAKIGVQPNVDGVSITSLGIHQDIGDLFENRPVAVCGTIGFKTEGGGHGLIGLLSETRITFHQHEKGGLQSLAGIASLALAAKPVSSAATPAPVASMPDPVGKTGDHQTKPEALYFQKLLDQSEEGICILDKNGKITMANPALERLLGVPAANLSGHAFQQFETEKQLRPEASTSPDREVYEALIANNGPLPLEAKITSSRLSNPGIEGSLLTIQKKVKEASPETTTPFPVPAAPAPTAPATKPSPMQNALDQSSIGVFSLDTNANIVDATGGIFRLENGKGVGKSLWEFFTDPAARNPFSEALTKKTLTEISVSADSTRYRLVFDPQVDTSGQVTAIVGTATACSAAAEAPAPVEEIFSPIPAPAADDRSLAILEAAGVALVAINEQKQIQFFNRAAERFTGIPSPEANGRMVAEVCNLAAEGAASPWDEAFLQMADSPSELLISGALVKNQVTGQELDVSAVVTPLLAPDQSVTGLVACIYEGGPSGAVSDDDRERLEAETFKALRVLAGGIAHDTNNILTALVGNISLANMLVENMPEASQRLTEAERACFRAKDLSHQLLAFSKGGAPVKKASRLPELFEQTMSRSLRQPNINPDIQHAPDLWNVDVDEGQMTQALENLIMNAGHNMPNGGTLSVSSKNFLYHPSQHPVALPIPEGPYVKMSIRDEGEGLNSERMKNIFKPYFAQHEEGSGLGLATAYSIIKNHHGHVTVTSTPGNGTEFTVYLPSTGSVGENSGGDPEKPQTRPRDPNRPGRIMIIDDEKSIRDLATNTLSMMGCEIESFASSSQGVQRFLQAVNDGNPFDLVIMDLTIPGDLSGQQAMQQILKIVPEARGIASSGYSDGSMMAHYREYGFEAALSKPYSITDLQKVVSSMLSN
ncbi:MAG: ATP-binding protein [Verrucomicrobiota bacterium]